MAKREDPEVRFPRHVAPPDQNGCRLWTGSTLTSGYGQFQRSAVNGRQQKVSAHRFSWEMAYGPIPGGMTVNHICMVKRCVEITHLELLSQADNTRHYTKTITHCPQGHPYDGKNVVYKENRRLGTFHRRCRTCRNEEARRRYWQARNEARE